MDTPTFDSAWTQVYTDPSHPSPTYIHILCDVLAHILDIDHDTLYERRY